MTRKDLAQENLRLIAEKTELENKVAQLERNQRRYAQEVSRAKSEAGKMKTQAENMILQSEKNRQEAYRIADSSREKMDHIRMFFKEAYARGRDISVSVDDRTEQVMVRMSPPMRMSLWPMDSFGTIKVIII